MGRGNRLSLERASISAALAVTVMFASPSVTDAKVAAIRFEDLVARTPLIATVYVETVVNVRRGQFAAATVLDVLKGPPLQRIWILTDPMEIDDASMVVQGETALMFLDVHPAPTPADLPAVPKGGILFRIAQFGRGRMPIRDVGGNRYIDFWATDVLMRAEMPTVPAPVPDDIKAVLGESATKRMTDRLFRSAELTAIEGEIRRITRATASPPAHGREEGAPANR